jgi:hypothetical protein
VLILPTWRSGFGGRRAWGVSARTGFAQLGDPVLFREKKNWARKFAPNRSPYGYLNLSTLNGQFAWGPSDVGGLMSDAKGIRLGSSGSPIGVGDDVVLKGRG